MTREPTTDTKIGDTVFSAAIVIIGAFFLFAIAWPELRAWFR